MTEKTLQKIDIFISSPGDVDEEKRIALKVIEELNSSPYISDKYTLKTLEYKKDVPAAVGNSPQKTVDLFMKKTDQSDILICILWSRMGTPVLDEERGKEYKSGTEYEFTTAYESNQKRGKPEILLYRCTKSIPIKADFIQVGRVQNFFKRFEGMDAEFKGLYCEYKSNEEFKNLLRRDLEKIIYTNLQHDRVEKHADLGYPSAVPDYVSDAGITACGDVSIDNTGQIAIGNYINQLKVEKPSGEELFKLINLLDQKRKDENNKEILSKYNPSEIPDYPLQLRGFVTPNRADEITKGMIYLQDHRILLISGIGGVGKTTLVQALIETRPANVPLPFWFDFNININATLEDVLEKLASYMKAPGIAGFRAERREAGQDDINILTGELQKREQLWLVFDNLEIILNEDKKFRDEGLDLLFTSLRGSTHKAKIIVTSRVLSLLKPGDNLIDALDEKQELKGLKSNFAVDFLVKNGLEAVERNKLEELVTGVDGHPLALRLLIELVKKFGVSDTLNDLSRYQRHKEDTIKKARRLFEKLAGDEKKLLENISVFRKPETMTAIKAMFTERTSEDAVEKLIDKSLLETNHKGSYWLHPLIRDFSYDDLKNKKEIHQLAFSYYQSLKLPEKRTKKDDVQSLIEACYHACKAEEYDKAASIIFDKELFEDLDRWGEVRTLIELYSALLPKDHFSDNILLSNKQTHSAVLGNLGNAYGHLGEVEKSIHYYEKALAIAQEIEDRRGEGVWLCNIGIAYSQLGLVEKAIQYYERALAIAQEIRDRRGEGDDLGSLGLAYSELGQVEKSIHYYEMALAIAQEIRDRRGEVVWLCNIGIAYSDLRQSEKTIHYYEKALAIAQEIEDRRGEGNVLGNMGLEYNNLGQVEKAIEHYQRALIISQKIGDKRGEERRLGNLGSAYYFLGHTEKTIEHYQRALIISQEIGDKRGEGNWLNNLGSAFQTEKKHREMMACYLMSKKIYTEIKYPNINTIESNLDILREELGKNEFEKLLKEVEPVAEEIVKDMLK